MFVLKHRALLSYTLLFLAVLALVFGISETLKLILIIPIASAAVLLLFIGRRRRSLWRLALILLLITAAILPSFIYDCTDNGVEKSCGKTVYVSAVIHEITFDSGGFCFANGNIVSLSGKRQSVRAKLSYENGTVGVGDIISGKARLLPIDGEDTISSHSRSRGYRYEVIFEEAYKTGKQASPTVISFKMRSFLCNLIKTHVSGEGSELLCAMLLGERDGLSDTLNRNMTRLGLSHTLALSGMHFNILLLGLEKLLGIFTIDKRVRYLCLSALTALYLFAVGGTPSAMRAGLMMLGMILAFFLRTEYDALTALALSVGAICTVTPFAITDTSLLLSAFATLGILLAFGNDYGRKEEEEAEAMPPARRFLLWLGVSVKVTLAASLATLPLTAYTYGSLPLLLVFANLLFAPLMQLLLYASFLTLACGFLPPVSAASSFLTRIITDLAAFLADIPHTQISVRHPVLFTILCVGVALFFLLHLFPPRERARTRLSLLLFALIIGSSGIFFAVRAICASNTLSVHYATTAAQRGDIFLLSENGHTAVIDNTRGMPKEVDEIFTVLEEKYLVEIDAYVVTGYHAAMRATLEGVLTNKTVHHIYLPLPRSAEEEELLLSVLASAESGGSEVSLYENNTALSLGSASFVLREHSTVNAEEKRSFFSLSCADYSIAYLSAKTVDHKNWQDIAQVITSYDAVFFGTYGAGGTPPYLLDPSPMKDQALYGVSENHLPFFDTTCFTLGAEHTIRIEKKQ